MRALRNGVVLCTAALAVAGCQRTPPANQGDIPTASFNPGLHVDVKNSTRLPSGLYYRDLIVGTGPVATAGHQVTVNYIGWLADGTEFDATRAGEPSFVFPLGQQRVITGWDEGVAGMRVGGRRQLIIPPSLGYGPAGAPPTIPPNAILVFTIDLTGVQ